MNKMVAEHGLSWPGIFCCLLLICRMCIADVRLFYVNDLSTNGDVYTQSAGNDEYIGTDSCCPKATLQAVFDLSPPPDENDIIYIDTGVYYVTNVIMVSGGMSSGPLAIYGSVNGVTLAGSGVDRVLQIESDGLILSQLTITGGQRSVYCTGSADCEFSDITVSGPSVYGFYVENSHNILIKDVHVVDGKQGFLFDGLTNGLITNVTVSGMTDNGLAFKNSRDCMVSHALVFENGQSGITVDNSIDSVIRHVTLVRNEEDQIELNSGSLLVENCLMMATGVQSVCIDWVGGLYEGDYNNLHATNQAAVGIVNSSRRTTLYEWQQASTQDAYSLNHGPFFVDEANDDFRLAAYSPGIDAGRPDASYAREPAPNGRRVNQGCYGNTTNAQVTPSSPWLLAVSFNDGGRASGTNLVLRWLSNLTNASDRVRIEYLQTPSIGWIAITNNLPVAQGYATWNTLLYHGSPAGRWRVVYTNNPSIWDQTDYTFELRPFRLYVNDAATSGDIYCSAPGSSLNWGASSNLPLNSLDAVLAAYDLDPGDTVLLDTGTYNFNKDVTVLSGDQGSALMPVSFLGSTNGTVFNRLGFYSLILQETAYLRFEDITIQNGDYGLQLDNTHACTLRNIVINGVTECALQLDNADSNRLSRLTVLDNDGIGLEIKTAHANTISNAILAANGLDGVKIWNNSRDNVLDFCTIVSNNQYQVYLANSSMTLRNSIIAARGVYNYCLYMPFNGSYNGDYNNLYAFNGAWIAYDAGQIYATLTDWQRATNCDLRSISKNPLFADAIDDDYHLKSESGRFSIIGTWLPDSVTSPCIDLGDPLAAYAHETAPNGSRVNMGAYGNTAEASRGYSNIWIRALTLDDAGIASDMINLYWTYGLANLTNVVTAEYSINGGMSWIPMGTAWAFEEYLALNTDGISGAQSSLWRVVLSAPGVAVTDVVDRAFSINPVNYYVNDADTNGDVYTTAPGSDGNRGLRPDVPMASLDKLLTIYDLEPGNTVYIDTGVYSVYSNLVITMADAGSAADGFVSFRGSTNYAAGGTIWGRSGTGSDSYGFYLNDCNYVHLTDLVLTSGYYGVYLRSADHNLLERLEIRNTSSSGIFLDTTRYNRIANCLIWTNLQYGIKLENTPAMNAVDHCTLVDNVVAQLGLETGSRCSLSNSILTARFPGSYCIYSKGTEYDGNFNNLYTTNNARVGYHFSNKSTLSAWQLAMGEDELSMAHNPLFAAPEQGDFHLRSVSGRYVRATGQWVLDTAHSPCIDMADPSPVISVDKEPEPNGGRANLGAYGNTHEASLSSNNWLIALSYNDGGDARGMVQLCWGYATNFSGDNVILEYDPGHNHASLVIASNIPIEDGCYSWTSDVTVAQYQGSPFARWRVRLQSNPNYKDTTDNDFQLRPYSFYINDKYPFGDLYCTALGNANNSGVYNDDPLLSMNVILTNYDLEYGDRIFVDTGFYELRNTASFTADDAGSVSGHVAVIGSTNSVGSLLVPAPNPDSEVVSLISVDAADYIDLRNLTLYNGAYGLSVANAHCFRVDNVTIENASRDGLLLYGTSYADLRRLNISGCGSNGLRLASASYTSISNIVAWSNGLAGAVFSGTSNTLRYAVFALNAGEAQLELDSGDLLLEYSIVTAERPGTYGVRMDQGAYCGCYNNFFVTNGAFVAYKDGTRGRLNEWRAATGGWDSRSLSHDPLFANPNAGDFHLKSTAGRWYRPGWWATGSWVQDTVHSPCIDGGPVFFTDEEPAPHGNRINLGAYGRSGEASLSLTNHWLLALTYNDGGVARNNITNVLHWQWGYTTTNAVNLLLSLDGSTNFILLDTVLVNFGSPGYTWDPSPYTNIAHAIWRIELVADPSVYDETEFFFAINPMRFYINDTETNGDMYCTAPGALANDGVTPERPQLCLPTLLDMHDLEPGAEVFIDSGNYTLGRDITFTSNDTGSASDWIRLYGSTNQVAGGSIFASAGKYAMVLDDVSYFAFQDIAMASNLYGLDATDCSFLLFSNLTVTASSNDGVKLTRVTDTAFHQLDVRHCAGDGLYVEGSRLTLHNSCLVTNLGNGLNVKTLDNADFAWNRFSGNNLNGLKGDNLNRAAIAHCAARANADYGMRLKGESNLVEHCVFALNSNDQARIEDGPVILRYNIYVNTATSTACIYNDARTYTSDYNDYYTVPGGLVANYKKDPVRYLSALQTVSTQDFYSLSHDPLFVDMTSGDFHLRSRTVAGTYVDALGGWTNFAQHSPCIDTGPLWTNSLSEPSPNGGRLNLGLYGDTAEASLSLVSNWLLAVSFNDGGTARGTTVPLRWRSGLTNAPATPATIEYSHDNGLTWVNVTNGIAVSNETVIWNTTNYHGSPMALWRIQASGVSDVIDRTFYVRPLRMYVNDGSVSNDVYCTAPGSFTNWGISSNAPMADINALLARYDLDYSDRVFLDTGRYLLTNSPVLFGADDSGTTEDYVYLQGSTDSAIGTVFAHTNQPSAMTGVVFNLARYVHVSRVTFTGMQVGAYFSIASECVLDRAVLQPTLQTGIIDKNGRSNTYSHVRIDGFDTAGILVDSSQGSRLTNGYLVNGSNCGIRVDSGRFDVYNTVVAFCRSNAVLLESAEVLLMNATLFTNGYDAIFADNSNLTMYNTIVAAHNPAGYCLNLIDSTYTGDHNDILPLAGSHAAWLDTPCYTLADWREAVTQDWYSLSHDPLFVNVTNGDFHLRSITLNGTYLVDGTRTNFAQHSPCIDTGLPQPTNGPVREPAPYGSNVNIGAFGSTAEASLSSTSGLVLAISQNDGGVYRNPLTLYWFADAGVATVDLAYSTNGGVDWIAIVNGYGATNQTYAWGVTNRSINALWRVSSGAYTDVVDQAFYLNPNMFYVNDTNTAGDLVCTAPGDPVNRGVLPSAPALTLQDLLDINNIEAGDTIIYEVGLYSNSAVLTAADAGSTNGIVTIQGDVAMGTRLRLSSKDDGITLQNADHVRICGINISNVQYGVRLNDCNLCIVTNVDVTAMGKAGIRVKGATNSVLSIRAWGGSEDGIELEGSCITLIDIQAWNNALAGVDLQKAGASYLERVLLWSNAEAGVISGGFSNRLLYSTFYNNGEYQLYVKAGSLDARYCIFHSAVSNSYAIFLSGQEYTGDYNDLYASASAFAGYFKRDLPYLYNWQLAVTQDLRSINLDPLFVDPGAGDFHLRSWVTNGTYVNALAGWTNFTEHSPCIDTGPRLGGITNEPTPNGGRANLGRYGQTAQASLGRTDPWVMAITFNQGGTFRVPTNMVLRWRYNNIASNMSAMLNYTRVLGDQWRLIDNAPAIDDCELLWPATNVVGSPLFRWRLNVGGTGDTNEWPFRVRPYTLYANDEYNVMDLYCSATGSTTNHGVTTNAPQVSVQNLIDDYAVTFGDTIYIDTGMYSLTNAITLPESSSGVSSEYTSLIGATGIVGAVFNRADTGAGSYAFYLNEADYIRLVNLDIRGGYHGVYLNGAANNVISNVTVREAGDAGVKLLNSGNNDLAFIDVHQCNKGVEMDATGNRLRQSLVYWNSRAGVTLSGNGSNALRNCTIAYNGNGAVGGNHQVEFQAQGSMRDCIVVASIVPGASGSQPIYCIGSNSVLTSYAGDYNNLMFSGNAYIHADYPALTNWQIASGKDRHSMAEPPQFVNSTAGDFHLRSTAGAYNAGSGSWVLYMTNSPCIDTGDINAPNDQEPLYNGGMRNMGTYGNTPWASKSTDTDGDGLSDTFEVYARARRWGFYGYLPFGSSVTNIDTDNDNLTDYAEFVAGTDPRNPIQCFAVTNLYPVVDQLIVLNWDSSEGRRYAIHVSTNLMQGFTPYATNIPATPPVNTFIYTNASVAAQHIFRIVVELAP